MGDRAQQLIFSKSRSIDSSMKSSTQSEKSLPFTSSLAYISGRFKIPSTKTIQQIRSDQSSTLTERPEIKMIRCKPYSRNLIYTGMTTHLKRVVLRSDEDLSPNSDVSLLGRNIDSKLQSEELRALSAETSINKVPNEGNTNILTPPSFPINSYGHRGSISRNIDHKMIPLVIPGSANFSFHSENTSDNNTDLSFPISTLLCTSLDIDERMAIGHRRIHPLQFRSVETFTSTSTSLYASETVDSQKDPELVKKLDQLAAHLGLLKNTTFPKTSTFNNKPNEQIIEKAKQEFVCIDEVTAREVVSEEIISTLALTAGDKQRGILSSRIRNLFRHLSPNNLKHNKSSDKRNPSKLSERAHSCTPDLQFCISRCNLCKLCFCKMRNRSNPFIKFFSNKLTPTSLQSDSNSNKDILCDASQNEPNDAIFNDEHDLSTPLLKIDKERDLTKLDLNEIFVETAIKETAKLSTKCFSISTREESSCDVGVIHKDPVICDQITFKAPSYVGVSVLAYGYSKRSGWVYFCGSPTIHKPPYSRSFTLTPMPSEDIVSTPLFKKLIITRGYSREEINKRMSSEDIFHKNRTSNGSQTVSSFNTYSYDQTDPDNLTSKDWEYDESHIERLSESYLQSLRQFNGLSCENKSSEQLTLQANVYKRIVSDSRLEYLHKRLISTFVRYSSLPVLGSGASTGAATSLPPANISACSAHQDERKLMTQSLPVLRSVATSRADSWLPSANISAYSAHHVACQIETKEGSQTVELSGLLSRLGQVELDLQVHVEFARQDLSTHPYAAANSIEVNVEIESLLRIAVGKAELMLSQMFAEFRSLCLKSLNSQLLRGYDYDINFTTKSGSSSHHFEDSITPNLNNLKKCWNLLSAEVSKLKEIFSEISTIRRNDWKIIPKELTATEISPPIKSLNSI